MGSTYFDQARTEISDLLPAKMDVVMEMGCATGRTLEWLREKCGAKYTVGIELFESAAKEAEARCNEVHIADVTSSDPLLQRFENTVDLLLALDILEHLEDPTKVLLSIKRVMSVEGTIIASIPNVRNVKVLIPLIFNGEFTYSGSGILDRTHLRFYTKKSMIALFTQNGFDVISIKANGPFRFSQVKSIAGYMVALLDSISLGLFEGFLANQWLVVAKVKPTT